MPFVYAAEVGFCYQLLAFSVDVINYRFEMLIMLER